MQITTKANGYKISKVLGWRSNVFLLAGGDTNVLIDTSSRSWRRLLFRRLKSLHIDAISYLFLTHAHFDHADNAGAIKEKFGAKVVIHAREKAFLEEGGVCVPRGTNRITRMLTDRFGERLAAKMSCRPALADITFSGETTIEAGGLEFTLLPTPGHTYGSSVLIADGEIAIAGDTVFGVFPWSAYPPYSEDAREMVRSWEILLDTGCRLFLPSHGRAIGRKLLEREYTKRKGR